MKEFLAFCKEFEIPLNSKNELAVYRKVLDGAHSSVIVYDDFKTSLKLLFAEVQRQKIAALELLLRKRIKTINAKMQSTASVSAE